MKHLLLILLLVISSGCTFKNMITYGQVQGLDSYISNKANFSLTAPAEWIPTTICPIPGMESIANRSLVQRNQFAENGYFYKTDMSAIIIVQTLYLLLDERLIRPDEITNNDDNISRFNALCDMRIKYYEKVFQNASIVSKECIPLKIGDPCTIGNPCPELVLAIDITGRDAPKMLTKSYIISDNKGDGWMVLFILISKPNDLYRNEPALDKLIGSMK